MLLLSLQMLTNVRLEAIPANITVTTLMAAIAVRVNQATNYHLTGKDVKVRSNFHFFYARLII